jgi:hypothetical protein
MPHYVKSLQIHLEHSINPIHRKLWAHKTDKSVLCMGVTCELCSAYRFGCLAERHLPTHIRYMNLLTTLAKLGSSSSDSIKDHVRTTRFKSRSYTVSFLGR